MKDNMNNDLKILFSCHKTLIEMLTDRGFNVPDIFKCNELNDFKYLYQNKQVDIFVKEPIKCFAKFVLINKARPQLIREIIDEIRKDYTGDDGNIIIILRNKPHNSLFKINKEFKNIQFFWISELVNNLTRHRLNPKFIKLSESEILELMSKYNLRSKIQLSIMLQSDPISKYFNFQSGDICKIIRNSPSNGEYISYRCIK